MTTMDHNIPYLIEPNTIWILKGTDPEDGCFAIVRDVANHQVTINIQWIAIDNVTVNIDDFLDDFEPI